jgi:hypothetical protein
MAFALISLLALLFASVLVSWFFFPLVVFSLSRPFFPPPLLLLLSPLCRLHLSFFTLKLFYLAFSLDFFPLPCFLSLHNFMGLFSIFTFAFSLCLSIFLSSSFSVSLLTSWFLSSLLLFSPLEFFSPSFSPDFFVPPPFVSTLTQTQRHLPLGTAPTLQG